jgi:bacterioferritin (cytochrome b1)
VADADITIEQGAKPPPEDRQRAFFESLYFPAKQRGEGPSQRDYQTTEDVYAERQRAKDEQAYQNLLPVPKPAAEKPSAIVEGIKATVQGFTSGGRAIADGLAELVTGSKIEGGDTSRVQGARRVVIDGLLSMGLSPFAGLGVAGGQALENAYPETAKMGLTDAGVPSLALRALIAGKSIAEIPSDERAAMMKPITMREAVELAAQFGIPALIPRAVKMAKELPQAHREAVQAMRGTMGAMQAAVTEGAGEMRLNVERVAADARTKQLMADVNQAQSERLAEHRRVQTHETTVEQSRGAFATLEDALAAPVEDLAADKAKALAFRDYYNAVAAKVSDLQRRTLKGDAEAADALPTAFAMLGDMAVKDEMAGATIARGLEARKIMSEAGRVDVSALDRQYQRLTVTLAQERAAVADLTAQLAETRANAGVDKLGAEVEKATKQADTLTQQLGEAKADTKAAEMLTKQLADEQKTVSALKDQIAAAKDSGTVTAKMQREMEKAQEKVDALAQQLKDAQAEQKQSEMVQQQIADEKARAAEMKQQIDAIESTHPGIDMLSNRLMRQQAKVEALEAQVRDAGETAQFARNLQAAGGLGVKQIAELRRQLADTEFRARMRDEGIDPLTLANMLAALPKDKRPGFAKSLLSRTTGTIYQLWQWAILSGPIGHAANVGTNMIVTAWTVPERIFSATYAAAESAVTGLPAAVRFGETVAQLQAVTGGVRDAVRLLGQQLKEESKLLRGQVPDLVAGTESKKAERAGAISSEAYGLNPESPLGAFIDYIAAIGNTTYRALGTEDALSNTVLKRMETGALAWRDTAIAGLEGEAFAREYRRLADNPTPAIEKAAETFALTNTFNRELYDLGAIGTAGRGVMMAANAVPMGRVVVTFIVTPTNMLHWALERTPIINLAMDTVRADLAAGGARRAQAMGKIMTSALIGGAIAELASTPISQDGEPIPYMTMITGSGPKDPKRRRDLLANGWLPYAVYDPVNKRYISMQRLQGGIVDVIMGVAQATEIMGQLGGTDAIFNNARMADVLAGLTVATGQYFKDKAMLKGLSDLFDAMNDKSGHAVERWVDNMAGSVVPGLVRQVNQKEFDPVMRETRGALDRVKAGLPGWSDTLPPQINPVTGEERHYPAGWGPDIASPVAFSLLKNDPVLNEINRNRIVIADIPKALGGAVPPDPQLEPERVGQGILLKPEERHRLAILQTREVKDGEGRTLHERLRDLVASEEYQRQSKGPDGERAVKIREMIGNYQKIAIVELRKEFPQLDRAISLTFERRRREKQPEANRPPDAAGMGELIKSLRR